MANLPITSRVLKSSKGGMKITDPILNVGTVAKQTKENVNLSGKGGSATIEEKINKEAANVSGGNLENFTVERDYSGEGPQTQKEKDAYAAHKEKEKTDPCYQYKAGRLKCPEGSELNVAGATPGNRDTCCAKKTEEKRTCADGSEPDAEGNCITKSQEITNITPETQQNTGMTNFQARQQGRKGIQNERKLKRFKIRDAKNEAKQLGLKGKEKRDFLKNAKLEAKRAQNQANIKNFQSMSDNIATQTEQGSSGDQEYTADKFLTKNQKLYTPQLSVGEDGKINMETDAEILNRVQGGGGGDKPKTDYSKVFSQMSENLANKDFSLNNSDKPKPTTFFGPGDDKPTFKDVISGIGDNLVGEKSIFAKKEGGTDVGNALRAINPFKKKGPKTQSTSDVLNASDFADVDGPPIQKRKPLKKNFFNK